MHPYGSNRRGFIMYRMSSARCIRAFLIFFFLVFHRAGFSQAFKTPLDQNTLDILANEISGQMIYNNEVLLAGAPWVREPEEFTDTFYESGRIYELVKSYGIETTRLERHEEDGTFDYPFEGEFWILKPEKRLVARLGADAALVAGGSQSADVTGELVYIPPLKKTTVDSMLAGSYKGMYRDKIALMWSHGWGDEAKALDSAGVRGVISFRAMDRYMDPNQVIYSRGGYGKCKNLKFGFSLSWRQWSELLEDLQYGEKITVRCYTRVESFSNKYETVFSWIPGTEPDEKGVVFSAHLFEGYTKRGANDNMSGCVVQLEILRALTKLIREGTLPQPRRTMYFVWPDEIGGTYAFIGHHSDLIDKWSINLNMDMVGEGLRKNKALLNLSETPTHLPSYLDGLVKTFLNYVWRTNDIIYLPDSPRGRRGGQYFPKPMVEKNGSTDPFRFLIHRATGGSDHICFNNPSVGVPGVEFSTWPDQWYHADTDLPDKGDPTHMKRIAFIGAACAWAAAHCTDEVFERLLDAVSDFGYQRVGERYQSRALRYLETAAASNLDTALTRALDLVDFAVTCEIDAIRSIEDIYSKSSSARAELRSRIAQWELFGESLALQVSGYADIRAEELNRDAPEALKPTQEEIQADRIIPIIHPDVKGKQFSIERSESFKKYLQDHPDVIQEIGLERNQMRAVINFVNGERSIATIWKSAMAETDTLIPLNKVISLIELIKAVNWIKYR